MGIVPKVGNPNETQHPGRITKRDNKPMRTTLVQCGLVATARRLLSIIHDTLGNGWVFEDYPNFKIK